MEARAYIDEIKLKLTGGVVHLELSDATLQSVLDSTMREVQRYIDTTKLITIPYKQCIDMTEYKPNSVSRVYRSTGFVDTSASQNGVSTADPMQVSFWQIVSGGGNLYNFQNYAYDYAAWNTLLQIRNTTSTDMAFQFDKSTNYLYINVASNFPTSVTIEYVPKYVSVDEITSDYWIDVIMRMALATSKILLGRIRSKYKQSNSLWSMDGDQLLQEGTEELKSIRETLAKYTQLTYPID